MIESSLHLGKITYDEDIRRRARIGVCAVTDDHDTIRDIFDALNLWPEP